MHAVRTPVFGIGFAIALLIVENLGARAYIAEQIEELGREEPVPPGCTAFEDAPVSTVVRY